MTTLPAAADILAPVEVPAGALQRLRRAGMLLPGTTPPATLGDCDVPTLAFLAGMDATTTDGQRFVTQAAGLRDMMINAPTADDAGGPA